MQKPRKKSDRELLVLICQKIDDGNYVFLRHAKQRLEERDITDIEVLNILRNQFNCHRRRNKAKDCYVDNYEDWSYCIEGKSSDSKVRVIVSFSEDFLLIITAIRVKQRDNYHEEKNLEKIYL